jgi:cytochrome b561
VVSLLLAGLLLTVAGRQVLVAVVLFALAFVALDLRESVHQASEARAGLLAIALLAAVAHLGAAGLACIRLRTPRRTAASP